MDAYDPHAIETKWQEVWEAERAFAVENPAPGAEWREPHFYMLEMLPYPSGTLHMGHVLNYTLGDVVTHFRRRNGSTVLRPMGFDSFGLPAENAAIKEGGNPLEITERNIASIARLMRRMGWAIDWDREVSAHEPSFYRWTQWLFLKLLEHGLAYRKEAPVNWCPNDQTVLSNEHVVDGRCWRCGAVVEARNMEQWFFKITAYADELLDDLETIDWPERTKKIQTQLDRTLRGRRAAVPRRGARPRHRRLHDPSRHGLRRDVLRRRAGVAAGRRAGRGHGARRRGRARTRASPLRGRPRSAQRERRPASFTGRYAINPVNGERIPIWVADYVLMEYGTGAIMAVPGARRA